MILLQNLTQKQIYKGIDISHWQGNIDFNKVKTSGIEFAILKAGGSDATNGKQYKDKKFEEYYRECKRLGIPVGAYFFVGKQFTSNIEGMKDAYYFAELLSDKQFEFPVCVDVEATSPLDRKGATNATIAFCQMMEQFGYYVSIYASDISGFVERLEYDKLTAYDKWVARYGYTPKIVKTYGMYQYCSTGNIWGIDGNVDLDYAYYDFPAIMKNKHLNGY